MSIVSRDSTQLQARDKRVILIGIDSADWGIIRPWAEKGKLPNFKKLMDAGTWGILESTTPPITIPACLSLFSGKSPNNLGIYDFVEFDEKSHRLRLFQDRKANDMIWNILSQYDVKSVVINVPGTYPPVPFNGYMITGMFTTSTNYTYPRGLKEEIESFLESIGLDYIIEPSCFYEVGRKKQFVKELLKDLKIKFETAKYLFEKKDWRLFILYFRSIDIAQHFFLKDGLRDSVLMMYAKLDEYLGYFLSKVNDDTYLVLVSDHGSEEPNKVLQINSVLKRNGYLVLKTSKTKEVLFKFVNFIVGKSLSLTSRSPKMLSLARRILSRWSTRIPIDSYISLQNALILDLIDWEKTKAVGAGYAKTGKIYINAKNRQETLNEITICLKDLMKNYGLSLIVKKGSDLFTDAARAPDLFVISQEKGLSIDEDFRTDLVLADRFSNPKLASDHSYEGIFLFYGPNLKKGMASRDAKIVDLVPTLLWIMDIPIPKELDGKILFNLFDHDYVVSHVQRYQTMTPDEEVTKYWRKKNEEEEIKQRLNQLGYI